MMNLSIYGIRHDATNRCLKSGYDAGYTDWTFCPTRSAIFSSPQAAYAVLDMLRLDLNRFTIVELACHTSPAFATSPASIEEASEGALL